MKLRVTFREVVWMFRFWRRQYPLRPILKLRKISSKWRRFWSSYHRYADLLAPQSPPPLELLFPCVDDNTTNTEIEPIYFYQDAWAFEHIVSTRPAFHVDIGSHHKFVSLLSKVIPLTMVDIRPLSLQLDTLAFRQGSILALPFEDGAVPSVSSLCVVEHIGLGRYGDPLNPKGTEEAIAELKRILMPGGVLYLSVPLDDTNRTYFNAHRAFTESYLFQQFCPFEVVERRYIYGKTFIESPQTGFGVGCYMLRRRGRCVDNSWVSS